MSYLTEPSPPNSISQAAAEWFALSRDEDTTADERARLAEWLASDSRHRQAWNDLHRMWAGMDALPNADLREWAQSTGRSDTAGRPRTARLWRLQLLRAAGIAASVCWVFLGVAWLVLPSSAFIPWADYHTGIAERRVVPLPDGSTVTLDAASALSVNFTARERDVTLNTGRAFFRVSPDRERPFIVGAASGRIRAVGTAFDVNIANDSVAVSVREGHVRIALDDGAGADLFRGQSVRFGRTFQSIERANPSDIAVWRDSRLVFENVPLAEVLADLQRYRRGHLLVIDSELGARPVTGVFDTRQADQALDIIAGLLSLRRTELWGGLTLIRPVSARAE